MRPSAATALLLVIFTACSTRETAPEHLDVLVDDLGYSCRDERPNAFCHFCPNETVTAAADIKMIMQAIGFDRALAEDFCARYGPVFDEGGGCDSELGPWLALAGHFGIVNRFQDGSIDKAQMARIVVASYLFERGLEDSAHGFSLPARITTMHDIEAYVRRVDASERDFWYDSGSVGWRYRPFVEFMGLNPLGSTMADGIPATSAACGNPSDLRPCFGGATHLAKGGLAKMLLRAAYDWHDDGAAKAMSDSYASQYGHRFFQDSLIATGDWDYYVDAFGILGHADGVPSWTQCNAYAPGPAEHAVEESAYLYPGYQDVPVAGATSWATQKRIVTLGLTCVDDIGVGTSVELDALVQYDIQQPAAFMEHEVKNISLTPTMVRYPQPAGNAPAEQPVIHRVDTTAYAKVITSATVTPWARSGQTFSLELPNVYLRDGDMIDINVGIHTGIHPLGGGCSASVALQLEPCPESETRCPL